jgi:hypothetical protein
MKSSANNMEEEEDYATLIYEDSMRRRAEERPRL